jgi:DNA-directed RNA polymerase subunit RPC12/RpoP
MDETRQRRLQSRFPMLYRDLGMKDSSLFYGLGVGDGWFDLLWKLSEDLEKLDPALVASQVKEKFGTLRFYLFQSDLEMRHEAGDMFSFAPQAKDKRVQERIRLAEKQSGSTCEKCGAPGKLHQDGYWHVACANCEKKALIKG